MSQTASHLSNASVHAIGANPFRLQVEIAEKTIIPRFPSWALDLLILLAVMRTVIIMSCISIMVIPLFKGAAVQKRHYTLIRRVYTQQWRKTPYLVPNRCMIIAICETISGALYLLSAIGSYYFYSGSKLPEGPMTYISTWSVELFRRNTAIVHPLINDFLVAFMLNCLLGMVLSALHFNFGRAIVCVGQVDTPSD
ncbi:hypothetical protein DFH28DRAFT_1120237 [Melampsora americana]|nr:hypothetical protein DFH28DRAFT_1120237 [Melampsora americana]